MTGLTYTSLLNEELTLAYQQIVKIDNALEAKVRYTNIQTPWSYWQVVQKNMTLLLALHTADAYLKVRNTEGWRRREQLED